MPPWRQVLKLFCIIKVFFKVYWRNFFLSNISGASWNSQQRCWKTIAHYPTNFTDWGRLMTFFSITLSIDILTFWFFFKYNLQYNKYKHLSWQLSWCSLCYHLQRWSFIFSWIHLKSTFFLFIQLTVPPLIPPLARGCRYFVWLGATTTAIREHERRHNGEQNDFVHELNSYSNNTLIATERKFEYK